MKEMWVWPLGWEHPLEKEMTTHSNILALEIPWTEEPGGLQSVEGQRVGRDWVTEYTHLAIYDKKKKLQIRQFLCEGYWDTEIVLKAWASWWLRSKESACNWSGNWFLCWSIQWVWSLGWEDPLEKEMTTHSNILAWIIPRTEEPGGRQSRGSQRVGHNWVTNTHTHTHTHI